MERIVFLNQGKYPSEFEKLELTPSGSLSKKEYAERKILNAINEYNPKLNVSAIDYVDFREHRDLFVGVKTEVYNGVIACVHIISNDTEKTWYESKGYKVKKYENDLVALRIEFYLYMTNVKVDSRNTFVSQIMFPSLLDYAEDYLESPSYSIANHPFYFINTLEKPETSTTILRNMSSLYLMGIEYIEVFSHSLDVKTLPKDLKSYLKEYASDYFDAYDPVTNKYEGDNYEVDFVKKTLTWKTEKMISDLLMRNNSLDFHGSSEKFYWMETLPVSIFAYKMDYTVDYNDYQNFIIEYEDKFSGNSLKFHRCKTLLHYLNKFFI